MEAARLMHTARQMVDTSWWWLMRWLEKNATSLLVRVGGLKDDEACKLFCALRVTAVRFGLELTSQPKARRDAKEATDARAALRKCWVAMVEKLGPGYRTKRGAEMPDWVAVAHLPSHNVRRTLHRWSVEVPRAIMPNRQRTMCSFYTAPGTRVPTVPAPLPAQVTAPAPTALGRSHADEPGRTAGPSLMTRRSTQRRVPQARARRPQPRHNTGATTSPTYRRRGEWRPSRTHCVVSSPVMTPTGGALTQRRTSATRRRTTGPVVLSSITPTSLCSGKTQLSSTPLRVNECHW